MVDLIPAQKIIVNTVYPSIIEMILRRVMKFNFYEFEEPLPTWHDAFIVELLKWFDTKIEAMSERKMDLRDKDLFKHWKSYYEQYVRILYYFVVYNNIQDSDDLKMIFVYLFPVDKDDNSHRDDSDIISSEKLMKLYNYIIRHIPHLKKDNKERECLVDVLVGRWNNEKMKYKLDNIIIFNMRDFDTTTVLITDKNYDENKLYTNLFSVVTKLKNITKIQTC